MYELHNPRQIGPMLKEPLILKMFPYSGTIFKFVNYKNLNQNSKMFYGMNQGPVWGRFMKKPVAQNLVLLYL
jgi:hypothetical protein